jgi:hypothetical protein
MAVEGPIRLADDPLDGPVGVTAMAGGHVLRRGGVLAVTGAAHVSGDPLALQEHLDGAQRHPHLDAGAGVAVGHGVEVAIDVDVVVEAHLAHPPLGQDVGLGRQGLQARGVDLLEQLAAGAADVPQDASIVELDQQLGDGGVDLGQAGEAPVAQPSQQPSLDDAHGGLDLGLVARPPGPRRQHGGVVMGRHLGVGAVDLRVVEARLDHRRLRVVGHDEPRRIVGRVAASAIASASRSSVFCAFT